MSADRAASKNTRVADSAAEVEDREGESLVEQRHAEAQASHLFAEVRHNPDEIRDLFR
jgi:hypothetical protein